VLCGEHRREERLLSRTRVCVERVGALDDMGEGVFCLPFPQAPARPESHRNLGHAGILALASRYLVIMYKVAICHPSA
jgi:hypothetical protein